MVQDKAVQIEMNELPTGVDGRRLVPASELFEMLKDPAMREAVSLIEREDGKETAMRRMFRKQFVRDMTAGMHEAQSRRLIELAAKKASGKFFK